jgi:hypothetical protein
VIGPYRSQKELGVGGMGQVGLAEQTEPVHRQVALKLIKAGMYDSATVQRFKAERQSLPSWTTRPSPRCSMQVLLRPANPIW